MSGSVSFVVGPGLTSWTHLSPSADDIPERTGGRQDVVDVLLPRGAGAADHPGASPVDPTPYRSTVDACLAAASRAAPDAAFLATTLPVPCAVLATVGVVTPLGQDWSYLGDLAGARREDAMGSPVVRSLPEPLQDGLSVRRYDALPDGTLVAGVVLVRRAWEHDIVVALRTRVLQVVPLLDEPLLELLAAVRPAATATTPIATDTTEGALL